MVRVVVVVVVRQLFFPFRVQLVELTFPSLLVYMKVWGPDHVVEWLEGLGLGELKPTFKLQKVNGLLLTTATNTSLTALGVDKLGCRIKLLKNIRDYLDDTQVALMQKSTTSYPKHNTPQHRHSRTLSFFELGPSDWTVEETQRWLCVIGFERYFHLAEQHEITGAILEELDDEDIMEMGIVKLGHRKALLKKIHALFNEAENVKQDAFRPRRSSFDIVMGKSSIPHPHHSTPNTRRDT